VSEVNANQPDGTPTWIDLGIPDLDRAMAFYGPLFDWDFEIGPAETGHYTTCLRRGLRAAAIMPNPDPAAERFWWQVYFATSDCDATVKRAADAGGVIVAPSSDVMDQGRMALVRDPVGAQFGLWEGRLHTGCQVVNEHGALLRNDLVTPDPEPARAFYAAVFDFTLDRNPLLPDWDFSFLRRPDGHEIGGITGDQGAPRSSWSTLFQVADVDEVVERAVAGGGGATTPKDFVYGRVATVTDPFGTEFTVGAPPKR
jgi:predicted enzyme related to lactoylglutathione lyase